MEETPIQLRNSPTRERHLQERIKVLKRDSKKGYGWDVSERCRSMCRGTRSPSEAFFHSGKKNFAKESFLLSSLPLSTPSRILKCIVHTHHPKRDLKLHLATGSFCCLSSVFFFFASVLVLCAGEGDPPEAAGGGVGPLLRGVGAVGAGAAVGAVGATGGEEGGEGVRGGEGGQEEEGRA